VALNNCIYLQLYYIEFGVWCSLLKHTTKRDRKGWSFPYRGVSWLWGED